MPLPKQIRDQLDDVEKLQAELNGENEPDGDNVNPDAVTKAGEGDPDSGHSESTTPDEQLPENATGHGGEGGSDFEHKYNTLQGMYNADIGRLQAENRHVTDRVGQLEQLLADLSKEETRKPVEEPKPEAAPSLVSASDMEDYGDSIEIMRKVTKEETHSLRQQLDTLSRAVQELKASVSDQVIPQIRQVTERSNASSLDQFWSALAQRVPEWQEINNDQKFHSWLYQVDMLTGKTRQQLLEEAQKQLNVERVVAFFKAYQEAQNVSGNEVSKPSRSASELEKQVAPGRSRGTGAQPISDKARMFTPEDIKQFYDDVRKGNYNGRDDERSRIERDIFAAQREDRIVRAT